MPCFLKAYNKSIFKTTNNYIHVSFPICEITNKDIREAAIKINSFPCIEAADIYT